jgi:signal transduction histidine kinase/ligand-binding sensor domain-containing protein
MKQKIIGVLFFLCLACSAANLRAERLPIKVYTSADGLGSSFINYLMRDSRGFMWFCTRDGLSRFDGSQFVTYQIGDKASPPGMESIHETRDGSYWVGTTGGLYRFKADAVSQSDKASGGRKVLNAELVSSRRGTVFEDHAGQLWYRANDLYRVREQNGQLELESTRLLEPLKQNKAVTTFQIREAHDGCLWLNTSLGVVRRLPDGRAVLYRHDTDLRLGAASLIVSRDGLVWVVWGDEAFVIKPPPLESLTAFTGTLEQPLTPAAVALARPEQEIRLPEKSDEILRLQLSSETASNRRLFQSSDDHIWLSTGDELLEFDGRQFRLYGTAQGLPRGMAEMAEDMAGNLWIAGQAGLLRLDRRGLTNFDEADGLNSTRIYAISEARDGTLYFANGDFYLSRFDGKRFSTSRPQIASNSRTLWSSRYAFLSSANEWWILTTTKLYRFAAGNLQRPLATYDMQSGLKANEMFQIFEDSHGDIWLSQQPAKAEDFGLYRLKRGEKDFVAFSEADGLPQGRSASSFAEDRYGNLWFGFYEGGLVRFANGRFTHFTTKDGLPSGVIIDLLLDRQGRLWIASVIGGTSRIDEPGASNPTFTSFTIANGLSSNNTRTLTEDQLGNIYVGTVRGVDRVSADTKSVKHFSVSDGLGADFVVDSLCDKSGVLWFATTNGVSRLTPGMDDQYAAPSVWLGGLRIAGVAHAIPELGQREIGMLQLTHSQNNLQLDFFGLDFQAGETLRYQYRLEGADTDWSTPTLLRTVTFANLQPGSYRFLVRAINAQGLTSQSPAAISFRISPPLWLRWWFLILVAALAFALMYSFYRYRLARLREVNAALAEAKRAEENLGKVREERLTELERVRTRIATDLHDDIGASLTQISILSEVAQSVNGSDGSREHLKSIATVSNELVETMSDIVWAINPRKDHLQDLIQRMRRFASDLLSPKGIRFEFDTTSMAPEIPLGANPRREVFLIFKESLANVVKHAAATHVKIDFDFSLHQLILKIADNGNGFDAANLGPSLFSREKGGHGVLSMKKRAAEMSGKFDIRSKAGEGTVVEFQMPLDGSATTQLGGDSGAAAT